MKNSKKILLVALVLFVVLAAAPFSKLAGFELPDISINASAAYVSSRGYCGENVTYTYDSTKKELVISGAGPMYDYNYSEYNFTDSSPFSDSKIKSVIIEEGVTSIGEDAFFKCADLVSISISGTVKKIGEYAFYNCDGIKEVVIPGSVETIGKHAFDDCNGITSLTISEGVKSIGDRAFENCDGITSVTIPGTFNGMGGAFVGCDGITSVTISEGVKLIGAGVFGECDSLEQVYLPDTLTILRYGFGNCGALKEIALPKNLERVEGNPFYKSGLTKIYIPKSVVYMSNEAFKDSNIKDVYYEGSQSDWRSIEGTGLYKYGKDINIIYNHSHNITKTLVPATQDADGVIKEKCICGYFKNTTLHKIDSVKIKATEYFYTGNVISPLIEIKDSTGNVLKENIDYTITSTKEIKDYGDYDVTINFINNYSGKKTFSIKVYDVTQKIILNSNKVTLAQNQKFTIEATVTPATAKQGVKYKTADKKIAAVSAKGVIKGVAAGKTTITVTAADGKTEKISVEVCDVKLNVSSKTMNIGQTYALKLSNSKYKVSKWSSSNSKIVKVDSKGLITAKAQGTATITAKLTNGIMFTCKITVKKVSLSATKMTVLKYNNKTLTLNNALGTAKWSSSNTKVAKVSSNGVITGVAPGTATITATYLGVKYNCTVTVKNQAGISIVDVYWNINSADGVEPEIRIKNNTNKDIKYLRFYTEYRNKFADPAKCRISGKNTSTLKVENGLMAKTTKWFSWGPVIYNAHVSRVDIKKVEIIYIDNSIETVTINKYWCNRDYYYQ